MKEDTLATAEQIAGFAEEKNAENIVIVDVTGLCSYADALVICQGRSTRQTRTISNHIARSMKTDKNRALGVEGDQEGHWILLDFADVVVHVFYEPVREFYDIEGIWPDAKKIRPGN